MSKKIKLTEFGKDRRKTKDLITKLRRAKSEIQESRDELSDIQSETEDVLSELKKAKQENKQDTETEYLPEGNTLFPDKPKKPKDRFFYDCVIQLCNALKSKRRIFREVDIGKWIISLRKLHIADGVPKAEIEEVLNWYCQHIGKDWIPEAFSAKSFRVKFEQISAAMNRQKKKPDYEPGDEEDDFDIKSEEWTDSKGRKHRTDSISYDEPEQDDDEDD